MPRFTFVFLGLTLFSCGTSSVSTPRVPIEADAFETACDHLAALGCKEGRSSYDPSLPGPKGIPNISCDEVYIQRVNKGTCINPKALSIVTSCAAVHAAEQQGCEE